MHPVLFRIPEFLPLIGGIPINSFGTMMVLACLAGGWVLQKELERHGHEGKEAWDLAFLSLAAGLVGAKLYWVLTHPARLSADPLGTIFSGTGLTWYGGFAAGLLAFYVGLRRTSLPVRETIDGLGLGLPLAIAVGRVGCFLAGDDYGRPTASRFGVAFPEGHPPTSVQMLQDRFGITVDPALVEQFGQVVPVHPTQLYETGISLAVFLILFAGLRKHGHAPGWLFAVWLALYGIQRFSIELLRVNPRVFLGLTVAQVISILALAVGLYLTVRLWKKESTTAVA